MPKKNLKYRPQLVDYARQNRRSGCLPEVRMWKQLLSRRETVRYKFTRQRPIGDFIVDFYCAALKLAVEIDGDNHAEKQDYDASRENKLHRQGITVIRYSNRDVMQNLEGVCDDLLRRINNRKCELGI
ncbi:MAG: endonuclease domain-containing protein [Candidatus Cloacimonetes bacterium]|nr:endonuclease domain-containing protein [Candidatus Cloacimonadota bacterium]